MGKTDSMQFSGKNTVVTGAAKGIGRSAAKKFLPEVSFWCSGTGEIPKKTQW